MSIPVRAPYVPPHLRDEIAKCFVVSVLQETVIRLTAGLCQANLPVL